MSYPDEPTWWKAYEGQVQARYAQAGRPFPDTAEAFRWFSRCGYDIGEGMGPEAAAAKHLRELEQELGIATPPPEPPTPSQSPLVGVAKGTYERGFEDATGPKLVAVCHAGDLLSRFVRDQGTVARHLDDIAAAGYVGVRTWTVLYGDYWRQRTGELSPAHQADYWDHLRTFAVALRARGLRWLVSQGDLMRWEPSSGGRRDYLRRLAEQLVACGGLDVVLGVDAGNETWQNGEDDPARLEDALRAFLAVIPAPIRTLTSPYAEEEANRYLTSTTLRDIHSSRDAWPTPARRVFNIGYEADPHVYTVQSEGPGPGPHVSVMAEPAVFLEPETMGVLAACHAIGKALYVYMSSPGVISDEPFGTYPAFGLVPRLFALLPSQVQTWAVFHGGANRALSPWRILEAPDPSTDVRCDHAGNGDEAVCVIYGPPGTYRVQVVNHFEGVILTPDNTLAQHPVSWSAGQSVDITFRRGRVLMGRIR